MWYIGFMVWRIGNILDFREQIDWLRDAGFDAVSFHASQGIPGQWQGINPSTTNKTERHRLRDLLSEFAMCEIHAPFSYTLTIDALPSVVEQLESIIEFAGEVGASIVTIHGEPPNTTATRYSELWQKSLDELNTMANNAGLTIGLELMRGFEWLSAPRRTNIGVTLDVGHMYLNEGAGYLPYRTIGGLVRFLGNTMVHLHVHDYNGLYDHVEIGTGRVDFDDLMRSLLAVKYEGALCLELNPDRVSPEGIRRSMKWLRTQAKELDAVKSIAD